MIRTDSISLPVHFCEVINNSGCGNLLPNLCVTVFETKFEKFVRSLIWIPALRCTDWMIRVNSPAILNVIFLTDEVDMKIILWTAWWVIVKICLPNGLQCFITGEGHKNVKCWGQDAYPLLYSLL